MNTTPRSYWFAKFLECLYLLVAIYDCLMIMWGTLLYKLFSSFGDLSFAMIFTWIIIGICILSVIYSIYWHQKSKKEGFNSGIRHAFLRGVIRYFLAFQVSAYGFAKILKTQFGHVYMRDNTPVGKLNGFDLTWNYFGHSYTRGHTRFTSDWWRHHAFIQAYYLAGHLHIITHNVKHCTNQCFL
ncbi:hypothetical protein [Mucilaginibacter sp. NFR10]|uniref:hypothetical protein n=1 Tax=Mucilaginibacter sp. NFR10 TaxID=1566292 RepID=UPI0008713EDD|nr:hypothetical protein [Mucilaginibacter sp. NFR10]SCW45451.1 hypothetical protein SAMN03159284_00905 [Mucilaginibacter sp. NFR10]